MSTTQSAPWHRLSAAVLDYLLLSGLSTEDIRRMQEENIKHAQLLAEQAEQAESVKDPETRPSHLADAAECQLLHDHQHDELNLQPSNANESAPCVRAVSPPPWPWTHAKDWLPSQRQESVIHTDYAPALIRPRHRRSQPQP
jgi:hypothetical protein